MKSMYARGYRFARVSFEKSLANKFTLDEDKNIIPPFSALASVTEAMAEDIFKAVQNHEFISIEDFGRIPNQS